MEGTAGAQLRVPLGSKVRRTQQVSQFPDRSAGWDWDVQEPTETMRTSENVPRNKPTGAAGVWDGDSTHTHTLPAPILGLSSCGRLAKPEVRLFFGSLLPSVGSLLTQSPLSPGQYPRSGPRAQPSTLSVYEN